jgi:hypothetical protein
MLPEVSTITMKRDRVSESGALHAAVDCGMQSVTKAPPPPAVHAWTVVWQPVWPQVTVGRIASHVAAVLQAYPWSLHA